MNRPRPPAVGGTVLDDLRAIAGAFVGYHMRKRLSRDMSDLGVAVVAVLDDASDWRRRSQSPDGS